jgi:hypothetical protein
MGGYVLSFDIFWLYQLYLFLSVDKEKATHPPKYNLVESINAPSRAAIPQLSRGVFCSGSERVRSSCESLKSFSQANLNMTGKTSMVISAPLSRGFWRFCGWIHKCLHLVKKVCSRLFHVFTSSGIGSCHLVFLNTHHAENEDLEE